MIKKTYKLTIDLKNGIMNYNVVNFITEDKGCNSLEITLLDSATQYNLTGNTTRFVAKTPSGAILQQNCINKGGNVITIDLNQSFFTEQGIHTCEVQIYDTANQTLRVTFPSFKYHVTKSLINDDNIQADSNFTILQDMIHNVQNADRVSTEALETANEAKAIVDTLVPQANTASQNAQEALDRALDVATKTELANKIGYNGVFDDTNFDFIKNRVVQDGLIAEILDNTPKSMSIKRASHYTIQFVGKLDTAHPAYSAVFGMYSTSGETGYYYADAPNENSMNLRLRLGGNVYNGIDAHTNYKDLTNTMCNFLLDIDVENSITTLMINGVAKTFNQYESRPLDDTFTLYLLQTLIGGSKFKGEVKGLLVYDRALNQQEIQRNFSVLNNKPSIKELHATDSTGKTSILKLASSEDFVEMSTGRTLREEYMGVLKTMGKEFTADATGKISVDNGVEARLIGGEIAGKTVKSLIYDTIKETLNSTNKNIPRWKTVNADKPCFVILKVSNVIGNPTIQLTISHSTGALAYPKAQVQSNGYCKIDLSNYPTENLRIDYVGLLSPSESQSVYIEEYTVAYKDDINFIQSTFNGLSSAQAIISNNGQQYPIYTNEEDRANKKVISLGGVGDVKDTLEILEDGSGVYTQKTILHIINNFNDSQQATVQDGYLRFGFLVRDIVDAKDGVVLCDKLPNGTLANWNNPTFNCICSGVTGVLNRITMVIKESDIGGSSAQNIDDYFSRNPHTFLFKLGTPIITHIPKELVLSILTHKTNIWEVGGVVRASSFKITQPVDRIAEIEARLQALESTTVDVVLNK